LPPLIWLITADNREQILANDGPTLGHLDQVSIALAGISGQNSDQATRITEGLGEGSSVDASNAQDALLLAVLIQADARAVVGHRQRQVADDDGAQVALRALTVLCTKW
jgi:hypothetical protein